MKNFKSLYKLFFALPFLFMVSCDNSDDIQDVLTKTTTGDTNLLYIELQGDTNFAGAGFWYPFEIKITEALDFDVDITMSVTDATGAPVDTADYLFQSPNMTIPAGSTTINPRIGFWDAGGPYFVKIESTTGLGLTIADYALKIKVGGELQVEMSWDDDATYDYDLFAFPTPEFVFFGWYDASQGYTSPETITIFESGESLYLNVYDYNGNTSVGPATFKMTGSTTQEVTIDIDPADTWIEIKSIYDPNTDSFTGYELTKL